MSTGRRAMLIAALCVAMIGCSSDEGGRSDPTTNGSDATTEPRPVIDDDPVDPPALIPFPAELTTGAGHLHLDLGFLPNVEIDPTATDLGDEGYRLDVTAEGLEMVAATEAGAFYARQTFDQLREPTDDGSGRLPFVSIRDVPRFEWRGFMLDVSRHFFGVEAIKRQIDVLAGYKINRLHLHLTDDQGWRIQIDSWPDLTAIGSAMDIDGGPGGFFTRDDLAEITDYAAARFITVVPEVDLPGHVNAALASYGELNDSGTPTQLVGVVPFGQSALSLEAEGTARFIDEVIGELAAMTPGPYLHLGGDEAVTLEPCEYAGLVDLAAAAVARRGKIPIGWEETGTVGLPLPSVTQFWLDPAKAHAGADHGSGVIASPANRAYLDQGYDASTPLGLSWTGFVDVDTAYEWDPADAGFADDQLLGVESPLWTETIATEAHIDLMVYPRILGLAEIGWSPRGGRSWEEYRTRLAAHGPRLEAAGVGFYRSPVVDWPTG